MLDTRCWILDTECWMLVVEYLKFLVYLVLVSWFLVLDQLIQRVSSSGNFIQLEIQRGTR